MIPADLTVSHQVKQKLKNDAFINISLSLKLN